MRKAGEVLPGNPCLNYMGIIVKTLKHHSTSHTGLAEMYQQFPGSLADRLFHQRGQGPALFCIPVFDQRLPDGGQKTALVDAAWLPAVHLCMKNEPYDGTNGHFEMAGHGCC